MSIGINQDDRKLYQKKIQRAGNLIGTIKEYHDKRIPNMWIIPSVAEAAKIFPLWLKQREVIAGGSSPRGRTVFTILKNMWKYLGKRLAKQYTYNFKRRGWKQKNYQWLPCFHMPHSQICKSCSLENSWSMPEKVYKLKISIMMQCPLKKNI